VDGIIAAMLITKSGKLLFLCCLILLLTQAACVDQSPLPTLAAPISLPQLQEESLAMVVPPTFTPLPSTATIDPRLNFADNSP
jgi:hypothetical protein